MWDNLNRLINIGTPLILLLLGAALWFNGACGG